METQPKRAVSKFTMVALILGLGLNLWVVARSFELFLVPRGSDIRPMGWTVEVFCAFFAGGVFLLPFSYAGFCRDGSFTSRGAMGLSLLPLPLGLLLLKTAVLIGGLTLSD